MNDDPLLRMEALLAQATNLVFAIERIQPSAAVPPAFPKSVAEVESALVELFGAQLGKTERTVFAHRVHGHSDREIATELHVSESTVRTYTSNIVAKFDLASVRDIPYFFFEQYWARLNS